MAAALLIQQGYEVTGVFMKNWSEDVGDFCCSWTEDLEDARRVAQTLGIRFYVWNFEKEYREQVIGYFFKEYKAGRTPNPDVMCNREIKFKLFLEKALRFGADFVATGKPVLGIGFGAQLLASVLGGAVVKNHVREIGWYEVRLKRETIRSFHWHAETFTLPPDTVSIAASDLTPIQGFHRGSKVMGLQFHPEVTEECVRKMIENCGGEIRHGAEGEQSAQEILTEAPAGCIGHRAFMFKILDLMTQR